MDKYLQNVKIDSNHKQNCFIFGEVKILPISGNFSVFCDLQ